MHLYLISKLPYSIALQNPLPLTFVKSENLDFTSYFDIATTKWRDLLNQLK